MISDRSAAEWRDLLFMRVSNHARVTMMSQTPDTSVQNSRSIDIKTEKLFFLKNPSIFACQVPESLKALSDNNFRVAC
jgi:hypothetical protein